MASKLIGMKTVKCSKAGCQDDMFWLAWKFSRRDHPGEMLYFVKAGTGVVALEKIGKGERSGIQIKMEKLVVWNHRK